MSSKKDSPPTQVDPGLARQLERAAGTAAAAAGRTVGAVLSLRTPKSKQFLSAEETESIVKRVLQRVEAEVGSGPGGLNVFGNLSSFVVTATPQFIRKLIEQKEIATATANEQSEDLMIEPVKSEPVDLSDVGKATRGRTRRAKGR